MTLVFDPRGAGISGDMVLAALVDLGADPHRITQEAAGYADLLPGSSMEKMTFREERRGGVRCSRMVLRTLDPRSRPAPEMAGAVRDATSQLGISGEAASFAAKSVESLIRAESRIHGSAPDEVILHESASLDTLIDIVGTASALDQLGTFGDVVTMPVNVGSGTTTFSHGTFPNPAPAVLEILRDAGIPMSGSSAGFETATPTGACILAGLGAVPRQFYPHMCPSGIGYGAGSRNPRDFANVLAVVRGQEDSGSYERISVLETGVDDVTGESLERTISQAMENGALDAAVYPGTGKKGRPASMVTVLCAPELAGAMADLIIRQTGTLGVRITAADRYVVPRRNGSVTVRINGTDHALRYKIHTHRNVSDWKIEADDVSRVSAETGMPPRRVEGLARGAVDED